MATAKSPGANVRRDVDSIKDDIATLRSDLSATLKDVVAMGRAEAGDARERLEESIKARLSQLEDAADRVRERAKDMVGAVSDHVEEKPLQSITIAFGAGLLLGILLHRR